MTHVSMTAKRPLFVLSRDDIFQSMNVARYFFDKDRVN